MRALALLLFVGCSEMDPPDTTCADLQMEAKPLKPGYLCRIPALAWPDDSYPIPVEGVYYRDEDDLVTAGPVYYSPTLHTGVIAETPDGSCAYVPCDIYFGGNFQ